MTALKFFLVASVLVAVAAADQPTAESSNHAYVDTEGHRDKKDVLLSTVTYPYFQSTLPLVQPDAATLTRTISPISPITHINTVSPTSYINPYYRTVYPYSYYSDSYYPNSYYSNSFYPNSFYPNSYYPNNVLYLKK